MGRRLSLDVWKARLSRQIVFWVFLSIVVIEIIILIPSVMRRERELLTYLKALSAAQADGVLATRDDLDAIAGDELYDYLMHIDSNPVVLGGTLYHADGTPVGTFGEAPALSFTTATQSPQRGKYDRRTQRYDALWEMSPLDGRYVLIVRHDATGVGREFYQFIGRITGLIIIISLFVTGATMVVLEQILISPVLALRRDLLRAGNTLRKNQDARSLPFESVQQAATRQDELGDVVMAFEQMVNQVGEAIVERDQAEADLRLSEEKFSKAFYASPNPMSLSTLAGELLDVNDSFATFYGSDRAAILGTTVTTLQLWEDLGDRTEMLETLQHQGFLRTREYRLRTRQRESRTVLYSAETVQLNGAACILSVMSDITERKAAEEALRESEQRFRTLVEQATDALFVVDSNGRFLDVNQQACNTLGYTREELMGLTLPDVQVEVSMADLAEDWRIALGQAVTREGRHRRKDGSTFPVEVRLGRIEIDGQSFLLALARDITERKQVEQARARLAEIGELAAMIVHEVRNPLTTVLMGLQSFMSLDLPPRSQVRLSLAMEESERLQRLLNEILLYARDVSLDLTEIPLGSFLQELGEVFQQQPVAAERPLRWEGLDTEAIVRGDRDKLKQVFINLLSNACEASPAGETVTVSLRCVPLGQGQIHIHNGGVPIPPEILPKLTQPFFTTKATGNGLGLAITRRIIEAHQGTFWITSSPAAGTVAIVTLPLLWPAE